MSEESKVASQLSSMPIRSKTESELIAPDEPNLLAKSFTAT